MHAISFVKLTMQAPNRIRTSFLSATRQVQAKTQEITLAPHCARLVISTSPEKQSLLAAEGNHLLGLYRENDRAQGLAEAAYCIACE